MAAGIMCRRSKSAVCALHAFCSCDTKMRRYALQLSSGLRRGMYRSLPGFRVLHAAGCSSSAMGCL